MEQFLQMLKDLWSDLWNWIMSFTVRFEWIDDELIEETLPESDAVN